MTTLSTKPILAMTKPKLRFSIDALMGKDCHEPDSRDNSPPVADYSIPKYPETGELPDSHGRTDTQSSPVLIPIPTFPVAVRARPGYLGPSQGALYQRPCPSGMETAFARMILQGERYQNYPWYLQRHRFLHHRFPGPELPSYLLPPFRKAKRIRTAFSATQLMRLESAFDKNHYVTGNERKQLAESLGLTETQVKVWFQNRRTKEKRQVVDDKERNEKNQPLPVNKRHSSTPDPNLSPSERSETISLCDEDSDTSYSNEDRNYQREILL